MTNGRQGALGPVGRAVKGLICLSPRIRGLFEQRDQLLLERRQILEDFRVQKQQLEERAVRELEERAVRAEGHEVGMADSLELQGDILNLLRHFTPRKAVGFDKVRVGRRGDGGYVLLDDFAGVETALSFGIEQECSWDTDLAARGVDIHMYDHTVDGPPAVHPRFRFFKKKISAAANEQSETLGNILATIPALGNRILLKADIEGSEWEMFEHSTIEDLSRIGQIVCEFHDFSRIADPVWRNRAIAVMSKLKSIFEVVHVHGNNNASLLSLANIPFPDVIEVTMVHKHYYNFEDELGIFPTNLDFPNYDKRPDIFMGNLRFPHGVPDA